MGKAAKVITFRVSRFTTFGVKPSWYGRYRRLGAVGLVIGNIKTIGNKKPLSGITDEAAKPKGAVLGEFLIKLSELSNKH